MNTLLRSGWRSAAIAAVLAIAGACASPPRAAEGRELVAITNVTVIDVVAGVGHPGMTVVADHARILSVEAGGPAPYGARRIDGAGRFLIPGLWDMHVHHQGTGAESLPIYLANGVVGTRDMGSDADFILPLRDQLARGEVLGPRIVAAGPMLDRAPEGWPWRISVSTATEGTAAVAALADRGVDFIKVHDHTPREAYFAIAAEARRQGLPFAGHVPGRVTIAEAAEAGQASIEHLANNRVFTHCGDDCAAAYAQLATRGVWQTPTIAFFQRLPDLLSGQAPPDADYASPALLRLLEENARAANLSPEVQTLLQAQSRQALVAMAEMRNAGIGFLAGCDALTPGFCLHEELEWMTRTGMTPAEALRTATLNPALFLGRQDREGAIAVGRRPDMVMLDADPLEDIRNTRRIAAVITDGRVWDREALDRMLGDARARFTSEDQ
ncbi:MAG: imidazolonepropionase-like amidohydrolase [Brevundimonas sp.]|jgi:imidazolonepropionase-like amidohydrolase|uniref:amidohydrolase family protein n=1 Tax=Brevundimonas sp. TaxID=1871086 RepID=UPI0039E233A4